MVFFNKNWFSKENLQEDDDVPLPYMICHENLGYGKKEYWSVRSKEGEKKFVAAFATKKEASTWLHLMSKKRRPRMR